MNLKEVVPHGQNEIEIMLLAGGPSLNDFEDDIREKRESGMPLVTTNGTYNWCLDRGLKPSSQIVVDGRKFNKRFVQPHVDGCHYLLASQCDPEIVKAAPQDQILIWHAGKDVAVKNTLDEYDKKRGEYRKWYPVMGGATVMLRAIPLLIMLGYHRIHIYGFDSCLMDEKHHAYTQDENDGATVISVRAGSNSVKKEFKCHIWMWVQAQEFIDIQKMIAEHCELAVYGDGLISHIVNTGASLMKEHENGSKCISNVQQLEAVSG